MKKFGLFLLALVMVVGIGGTVGCSSSSGGGEDNPFVGTWRVDGHIERFTETQFITHAGGVFKYTYSGDYPDYEWRTVGLGQVKTYYARFSNQNTFVSWGSTWRRVK